MPAHQGWVVTDDLRDVDAEESHVGAVSPSMTPEAYLRIADAAQRSELELGPLLHRITSKGLNGTDRFLRDPRLRTNRGLGALLSPVWQGMANSLLVMRSLTAKAVNRFRIAMPRFRAPTWSVNGAPTKRARRDSPLSGAGQPAERRDTPSEPRTPTPQTTNPAPNSRRRREETRDTGVPQDDGVDLSTKPTNEAAPQWDTAHEWSIVNAAGDELFRGQAIGVKGDSPQAARARRAPLDEIPGLPKDASIRWPGNPEWNVQGVSTAGTARSAVNTIRDQLGREFSWSSLRAAGRDVIPIIRGDGAPAQEPPEVASTPFEEALARLRSRMGEVDDPTEKLREALERVQARVEERRTPDINPDPEPDNLVATPTSTGPDDDLPEREPEPDFDEELSQVELEEMAPAEDRYRSEDRIEVMDPSEYGAVRL